MSYVHWSPCPQLDSRFSIKDLGSLSFFLGIEVITAHQAYFYLKINKFRIYFTMLLCSMPSLLRLVCPLLPIFASVMGQLLPVPLSTLVHQSTTQHWAGLQLNVSYAIFVALTLIDYLFITNLRYLMLYLIQIGPATQRIIP